MRAVPRSYTVGDLGGIQGGVRSVGILSIEATKRIDELHDLLRQGVRRLRLARGHVQIKEERLGERTTLEVELDGATPPDVQTDLRRELAEALARHIVSEMEPEYLQKMVRQNYGYFTSEERTQIVQSAREAPVPWTTLASRLDEYLCAHSVLNLEGFVTFRLRDYLGELEDKVDQAVDDFLIDREYREFVRLLRYFVDAQQSRTALVHVVLQDDGRFDLLGPEGIALQSEIIQEFRLETPDAELNLEDLLVSSLITAAPGHVLLHGSQRALRLDSVQTVRQVFGQRVEDCGECPGCRVTRPARRV